MNRNAWKFSYPADVLLFAAREKKDYHIGRLGWWDNKKKETIEKIKAEGIEIDDSLAGAMSASNNINATYARQTSIAIREDLKRDLTECVDKMGQHQRQVREYDAWIQVLESQGKAALDLHQDDWLFFFGR